MNETKNTNRIKGTIPFCFDDIQPDLSSFRSRFIHFLRQTNPLLFFVSDERIRKGVEIVEHYKQFSKTEGISPKIFLMLTKKEILKIKRGIELMETSTNDKG